MQSISSRIWTRVAVSISHDDNHYTTGTSSIGVLLEFVLFLSVPILPLQTDLEAIAEKVVFFNVKDIA